MCGTRQAASTQNMYEKEFVGMTDSSVPYSELISTLPVLKTDYSRTTASSFS
jgi:hypothetical protein